MSNSNDSPRAELRAALVSSHAQLHAVLDSIAADQWETEVFGEGDAWTVRDVLFHLIDAERGMGLQVRRIRDGAGRGVPPDFDIDRWNRRVRRQSRESADDGPALLDRLDEAHAATLALLAAIEPGDWSKVGRQAVTGDITLDQWFRVIAGHKAQHAADIDAALSDA